MKTFMSIVFGLATLASSVAFAVAVDPTPTPPPHEKANYVCRILQDTNMDKYLPAKADPSQYALFRINCMLDATSTVDTLDVTTKSTGMPGCSQASTSTCVDKSVIPPRFYMTKSMSSSGIYFLVKNPNQRVADKITTAFFHLDLTPLAETPTDLTGNLTGLTTGVSIGGGTKDTSCMVYVSGASTSSLSGATCSGQGCAPARAVPVENGKLIFQAAIIGGVGNLAIPQSIVWIGGPDKATGVWSAPPVGKDTIVTAQVTTKDNVVNYCSVKFNQYGQGYTLKLDKYGDCPYYRALRNYYHLNAADSARQTGGYPQPLTIPGFDSKYGVTASDIPFRGVLNFAADTDGIVHVENGALVIPPLAKRLYSNPIVVARRLNTKGGQSVGEPVYVGVLNTENYALTSLRPVGTEITDDNALLVFQFFLAAKQEKTVGGNVVDVRGTADGLPYYQFQDAMASKPFDRLIPVLNDSCAPVFQIRTPARSDKALPKELTDAVTCAFSKPFKVGEFKSGRARLTLMHFTAESAGDEYPLDLISGNLGAPIATTSNVSTTGAAATGPIACWIVNPSSLGSPSWASGGSQGSVGTTSTSSKTDTIRERVPGDECSTRLHTNTTVTTSSTAQDLNGRLGFRYSYEAYAWGAAFGCAVSQNWPDRSVYGVVESSTAWTGASTAPPYGQGAPHFDKVSCVQGGSNAGLMDAIFSSPISLHSYVFSKSTADASQVRTQNFHVRPWGYDVADLNSDAVGSFFAPMCPGSQFAYDNVSLSWSPLIIDIKGKGIKISRVFNRSVGFDIKGTGYKSYIDWPENTSDVAILVMPDSQGQVNSVRELFGDDKYSNGFEKLRSYDLNKDKRIDAHDAVFSKLRLWFDKNRNGKVDKDELQTLDQNGVQFITLEYGRPGENASAEQKTLSGLYFNSIEQKFMNIEDHYFYEYIDSQRVKAERGNKKKDAKKAK